MPCPEIPVFLMAPILTACAPYFLLPEPVYLCGQCSAVLTAGFPRAQDALRHRQRQKVPDEGAAGMHYW